MLDKKQYELILNELKDKVYKDAYFESKIKNIYFDTEDNYLISCSMDKPSYKEKVRVRSYDIPSMEDTVFLEIKKKYKGVVSKRRIDIKLKDYYEYLSKGVKPSYCNQQIMDELDYSIKRYNLKPKLYLAYDRYSYVAKNDDGFRITFDHNIRSRETDLRLDSVDNAQLLFDDDMYVMELKILNALPLWFVNILSKNKIYPVSFSKYGSIYKKRMEMINNV